LRVSLVIHLAGRLREFPPWCYPRDARRGTPSPPCWRVPASSATPDGLCGMPLVAEEAGALVRLILIQFSCEADFDVSDDPSEDFKELPHG